jgi:hypothetical protein
VAAALLCATLAVCGGSALPAAAQGARPSSAGGQVVAFPDGRLYRPYLADPRRPGMGVALAFFAESGAADSGSPRPALQLGGSFGLVRFHPDGAPERGWQVSIEAGFYGQFDADHSLDNLGWDGIYGLLATSALAGGWGLKLGMMHTSSHVGDEYAERTGRRRLGYTREEVVLGVSVPLSRAWRAYAEGAWGYVLRSEHLQQPGRLEVGAEFEAPGARQRRRGGLYAAADLAATEERDWRLDASAQLGWLFPSRDRTWRAGLAWRDGQVPIGEFFQDTESYGALGLWLDL